MHCWCMSMKENWCVQNVEVCATLGQWTNGSWTHASMRVLGKHCIASCEERADGNLCAQRDALVGVCCGVYLCESRDALVCAVIYMCALRDALCVCVLWCVSVCTQGCLGMCAVICMCALRDALCVLWCVSVFTGTPWYVCIVVYICVYRGMLLHVYAVMYICVHQGIP